MQVIGVGPIAAEVEPPAGPPAISGGTVTNITGYEVHTFTASGTLVVTGGTATVEYLCVAGGGGGIGNGGGGAGGLLQGVSLSLSPGSYAITIGASSTGQGSNSSIADLVVAIGGGYSAGGGNGGSGAGGQIEGIHGVGTVGQGNNGGNGDTEQNGTTGWSGIPVYANYGGGGGGAGSAGEDFYPSLVGRGGDGIQSSITGTPTYYAGGGGGFNSYTSTNGPHGAGSGANKGGGAQGGSNELGDAGVVIVRIAV